MPVRQFAFGASDDAPGSDLPQVTAPEVAERFADKMQEIRLKEKEREAEDASAQVGVPYFTLVGFPISPEALSLIPEEVAQRLHAITFYYAEDDIRLGALDPTSPDVEAVAERLAAQHHARVTVYLISAHSLEVALQLYAALPRLRPPVEGVAITAQEIARFDAELKTFRDLAARIKTTSLTDLVAMVVAVALRVRASDIHFEVEERKVLIRYRLDGLLHEVAELDPAAWRQVVARIKLLSHLKINVADKPQDGRFTIFLTGEKIDVRVSVLPTTYGESVVMRLLMSSSVQLTLDDLGVRGRAYDDLMREIAKPNGMILTTGPTGSGKTTTLYAILTKLNTPDTKIITIEDPVEYRLEGINQSQIDYSHGYTFANGLRSILRQDPDIIMVGEIRDLETADISINAALTGHLVFSTIHTNDASGTVPRFLAMNVKSFLLAPALNCMLGQRLVRRVCTHCAVPDRLPAETRERVQQILGKIPAGAGVKVDPAKFRFVRGKGCDECTHLGYRGRIGIYEVMTMNPDVEALILSGHVSEYDMLKVAVKHGMVTMLQDGLLKAAEGITTVEEVFRVAKDTSASY